MAAGDRSAKDREMAAALRNSPNHSAQGVRRRKQRRFREFMDQFHGRRTGSAAHQRRQAKGVR